MSLSSWHVPPQTVASTVALYYNRDLLTNPDLKRKGIRDSMGLVDFEAEMKEGLDCDRTFLKRSSVSTGPH